MLAWGGSAVRIEEAFPERVQRDQTAADRMTLGANAQGFQNSIPANARLQLCWHDSNDSQCSACGRAIEVGEFDMVVETEKPIPVGAVVVVNSTESGFIGRASIHRREPKGFNYSMGLRMLDMLAREL